MENHMPNSRQEHGSLVSVPAYSEQGGMMRHVLHVLFKRKHTVIAFFLPVVAVALVYSFVVYQPMYSASARLLLEMGREHVSDLTFATGGAVRPTVRFDPIEQSTIAMEIIRGPHLLQQVVSELGYDNIYPDLEERSKGLIDHLRSVIGFPRDFSDVPWAEVAAMKLAETLYLAPMGTSGLVALGYAHPDPFIAAQVVNKVVEAFISRHLSLSRDPQLIEFFESEIKNLQEERDGAEQDYRTLKRDLNLSGPIDIESDILRKQLLTSQAELNAAEDHITQTKARIGLLQRQLDNTSRNPDGLAELKARLLNLELKEGELLLNYEEGSRVVQNNRAEMQTVRRKIASLGGNKLYGTAPTSNGSLYEQIQADLLESQVDLEASQATQAALQGRVAQIQQRVLQLNDAELTLRSLNDLAGAARERHKLYQGKYQESVLAQAMDVKRLASVKIIENARVPLSPTPDRRNIIIALAMFVGIVGGCILAFVQEILAGTLESPEDTEAYLGLPVLASIPEARLTGA
jgi:uncharacterized protein involved in exopolysaccharide biosynthesis